MRHSGHLERSILGIGAVAVVLVVFIGCGDDGPQTLQQDPVCERACHHVQADRDHGGCQQSFRFEDGSAMTFEDCVDACENDDLMLGGEECIGGLDECKTEPQDYIDECLPEDYHPPACDHLPAWDPEVIAKEEEVLELVNDLRQEGIDCPGEGTSYPPVDPVEMDEKLRCASRLHSIDMVEDDFFGHNHPDGTGPQDRAEQAGYDGMVSENIAFGSSRAEQTVNQWLGSEDGHCGNMADAGHEVMGVGMYQNHWTQKFGNR